MAQEGQSSQVTEVEVVAVDQEEIARIPPTGVSLGTCICGISIRLHWSMFLIVILSLLVSLVRQDPWIIALFNFLLDGPILFLTVFTHEIGHALVTLRLGGEVRNLVLWPGGGLTVTGPNDGSLWSDFKAAIAGPLMHLPQMLLWFFIILICQGATDLDRSDSIADSTAVFFWNLAFYALRLNVLILLANIIIPIYPFDAGRIFSDLLMMTGMNVSTAAKITASVGVIVGVTNAVLASLSAKFYYVLVEIMLALVIIAMSLSLFSKANGGRLKHDIIFGRACYYRRNDVGGGADGSNPVSSPSRNESSAENEIV